MKKSYKKPIKTKYVSKFGVILTKNLFLLWTKYLSTSMTFLVV